MKIQSKIKLNHKGEQSEVGYINLLQDGYLTIDNLERGDYVLTMYVQCDSIGNISIGEQSQDITTSWDKVSYILSNVENIINIKFKKGVYYIYDVKLEKGNKATDWTPAPEDTEESIDNVNTKAQGIIDNIYTPNTTTIDGGKITTGTITAAQIAADTITSNEIAAGTITSNEIAAGTITSNEIAAGTITADKINLNDLFAQNITATGTITGATLKGTNAEITSGSIAAWKIEDNTLVGFGRKGSDSYSVILDTTNTANITLIIQRPDIGIKYSSSVSGEGFKAYNLTTNEYSSVEYNSIIENGTALSNKYLGINANAVSATKATQDGNGNNIVNTYAAKEQTSACTYSTSGQSTATTSTSAYTKISVATKISSSNDTIFVANNGGVKITKAGKYLISGYLYMTTGITDNDIMHLRIIKNSSIIIDTVVRLTGTYTSMTTNPVLIDVSANDVIYIGGYNQTRTGTVLSAAMLTIQRVS